MAGKTPKRELKRLEEAAGRGRSAAHRYVRRNLARFVKAGVGEKGGPTWEAFAALLEREGQKNAQGGPISADSARRLFERARRHESERERQAPPPRQPSPSRFPVGLRPSVEPPRAPATPRPAPPRHTASPPAAKEDLPPEVRAKLAALQDQFDYVDRYVRPPKREE